MAATKVVMMATRMVMQAMETREEKEMATQMVGRTAVQEEVQEESGDIAVFNRKIQASYSVAMQIFGSKIH